MFGKCWLLSFFGCVVCQWSFPHKLTIFQIQLYLCSSASADNVVVWNWLKDPSNFVRLFSIYCLRLAVYYQEHWIGCVCMLTRFLLVFLSSLSQLAQCITWPSMNCCLGLVSKASVKSQQGLDATLLGQFLTMAPNV